MSYCSRPPDWPYSRKSLKAAFILAGVFLYFGYVIISAASATHMSGRFFAVGFLIVYPFSRT